MVNAVFTTIRMAAIVAGGLIATACATLPEASTSMTMASAAPAPMAYLDFCARSPGDCATDGQAVEQVAQARAEAQQFAWNEVFKSGAASAPAAIKASSSGRYDWSAAFAASGTTPPLAATPAVLRKAVTSTQKLVLDEKLWAQLNKVNRKINHDLVRRSDQESYGQEDFWATPLSDGKAAYGDCEDYVLEKRRALIAGGVPANALSAAIVTTSWGETHAVLLVDTDRGEYVLDNLSSFVAPWSKVGYSWRERQFGDAFTWGLASLNAPGLQFALAR